VPTAAVIIVDVPLAGPRDEVIEDLDETGERVFVPSGAQRPQVRDAEPLGEHGRRVAASPEPVLDAWLR
jgi:hypothetical protein